MNDDIQYAIEHGIIDLEYIRREAENMKRKEILSKHPYDVWKGKNGKWYTYIDIDGKRLQRKRNSRAEIEDLIVECIKQQETNPTIESVFNEWNDWKVNLHKVGESTYLRYKSDFNRFYGKFGKRHIKDVAANDFRDFLETQVPTFNLTAKAFSNLKTITKGFLKYAKRKGYIDWNYDYMLSDVDISDRDFTRNIKEDYEEVYSDEEMDVIMNYLLKHLDTRNCGILLMFVTGIRVGELSALKPNEIGEGYINIRRTESRMMNEDGKPYIGVKEFPKTEAGWRTVAVPTEWWWLLEKIRMMNPWGEWCFISEDPRNRGERMRNSVFEKRLLKLNTDLHIYHKSPHKIRKTYGSILLDESVDQNLIIQQMGHTSIGVTEKYYHRNRKSLDKKVEVLDAVFPDFGSKNGRRNHGQCQKMLNFQAK